MNCGAVLLAAGLSRRAGEPKLLAQRHGVSLLHYCLRPLLALQLVPIVAVVSEQSQARALLQDQGGVELVTNPDPQRGLSSSLQLGVAALPPTINPAFVVLSDMPEVSLGTYRSLYEALGPRDFAVVPSYAGRRGHPLLLSYLAFPHLLSLSGDLGLRHVLRSQADAVREVPVSDSGVLVDIDDRRDLDSWRNCPQRSENRSGLDLEHVFQSTVRSF